MRAAVIVGIALVASVATAREAARPWAEVAAPAEGSAESIGGYSAGCLRGGKALAMSGTGYQVMRPSRRRYFGHPVLIDFVEDLGAAVAEAKLGVVLVGDLGQARGGPAPTGHASHQSGLDADIWFWHPKVATRRPLKRRERERVSAKPMADPKTKSMTKHWTPRAARVLRLAAEDERVARIFVNPLIKQALCKSAGDDRAWLRKLRPWWGHNAHFHVRLACPAGSPDCEPQKPLPEGDGCDGVDWWLDDEAQAARQKSRKGYRSKIKTMPTLPERCTDVLGADAPAP